MSNKNKPENKLLRRQEREDRKGKKKYPIILPKQNEVCKNAVFIKEKMKDTPHTITINKGCKNLRRNGSAWCEKCAKKT